MGCGVIIWRCPVQIMARFKYMIRNYVAAILIAVGVLFLNACGSQSSPALLNASGNWSFEASPAGGTGIAQGFEFGGGIVNANGRLTGIFHMITDCYQNPMGMDIPYTGTIDSAGDFRLQTSSIQGQVLTLTGMVSADASTLSGGTLTIVGGCGDGTKDTVTGMHVPSIAGTWNGQLSLGQTTLKITEQLTQSTEFNADGNQTLGGTITVQGSPCFTKGYIYAPTAAIVSGNQAGGLISMDDGSALSFDVVFQMPSATNQFGLATQITVFGGNCSGQSGAATLYQ